MFLRWLKSIVAQNTFLTKHEKELSSLESSFSFLEAHKVMWLIVGVGNPGKQYVHNRHNVGFMVIDRIAETLNVSDKFRKKFQGEMAEATSAEHKIILLKPMTFMNLSGQSVQAAAQFYKIETENIIVFHDEIDIDPNTVRIKKGGGNAGHNGLKSIQAQLGTSDYWRVRIGIGRCSHGRDVSDHVLDDFSQAERVWVEPLIQFLASNINQFINSDTMACEKNINDFIKKNKESSGLII